MIYNGKECFLFVHFVYFMLVIGKLLDFVENAYFVFFYRGFYVFNENSYKYPYK